MSDTEIIPYIALGAAAITGISTILGIVIANRSSFKQLALRLNHESEKDRKNALKLRLEELYMLIEKWANSLVTHHSTYRKVMNGALTYNQALDITIESKSKFDTQRLFTLAELYFPRCHETLNNIKSIRDQAADIQEDFKELYRETGSGSSIHAEELTNTLIMFSHEISKYKSELSEYANKI